MFYIVVALLENQFFGGTNQFNFSLSHIGFVLLFSVPSNVPGQLWFLIALLEVYIIYFFIDLLHARKLGYWVAMFTFLAMIMLAQGFWFYYGYKLTAGYYRNAWIEGFSFFALGYFLHNKQNKLAVSNKVLLIVISASVVMSVIERFLCGCIFAVHLSTYPLVISLFIYAIKNGNRYQGVLQQIGKKYSIYVYILHMFWWHYFDKIVDLFRLGDNAVLLWFRPLIVLGLALPMSMGCYYLFNKRNECEQVAK